MLNYFDGIYGQEPVKEILSGFLANRKIPQALLFSGPAGVGKDYVAIRFANLLNQSSNYIDQNELPPDKIQEPLIRLICPLPVGKNESSDDGPYDKLPQSDIELIQEQFSKKEANPYHSIKIPRANDIKISSIRSLTKYLSLSYDNIEYRVVLVSQAHLMNEPAQNSLLKNLEEPPPGFVFILTTPEPSQLRETIRSRCWPIEFRPLSPEDVTSVLVKYFNLDTPEADVLGRISGGSVAKALYLKDKNLFERKESIVSFLRNALAGKIKSAHSELKDIISENDSELFRLFFSLVLYWFEDFKRFLAGIKENLFFAEHTETFEKFALRYKDLDPTGVIDSIEKILYYVENNNVNMNIAGYNIMFLIASLIQSDLADERLFIK